MRSSSLIRPARGAELERKGRKWTWTAWEGAVVGPWPGNYAKASLLAGMIFFALLTCALMMKAVAPTPPEMDESPMLVAKREAARTLFQSIYMADCDLAALAAIKEPFRSVAKKTGLYSPEAFAPVLKCIDEHLAAIGVGSIERQLRANKPTEPLLDLNCVGDLRQGDLCTRAFTYARNRGHFIGMRLAEKVSSAESSAEAR